VQTKFTQCALFLDVSYFCSFLKIHIQVILKLTVLVLMTIYPEYYGLGAPSDESAGLSL